mgnify:CR=1 FL=1
MQGRGLKLVKYSVLNDGIVAPHAGAWIETGVAERWKTIEMSPLMQGRGLKLRSYPHKANLPVAPHAGAWIETMYSASSLSFSKSPLMQGRGLKLIPGLKNPWEACRPSCRGVD